MTPEDTTAGATPDSMLPGDPAAAGAPTRPPTRPADRLPDWIRSIRFRYTVLYSAMLFGLAALLVGSLYVGLSMKLRSSPPQPLRAQVSVQMNGEQLQVPAEVIDYRELQRRINSATLDQLRDFSFIALAVLFVTSLGVGWMVAGRVLAPIARITDVARDIQATDMKRRIRLQGPDDELKQLSDTFDDMLARLDAAFDAQQRFVADASHELRNPLAVIRTNVDIALSDPDADTDDLRQTATVVKRASARMAGIVDDLLLVARRQVPGQHHDLVYLEAVVAEEIDEFTAPAGKKGITLEQDVAAGLAVVGDRDALRRALANLLENAIRHSSQDGRVRIVSGGEADEGWAWVAVIDQGPGIEPEHQKKIFDRFWRADKARSRAGGGSGLGLSIVRQIARSHGGDVQVRSHPGKGSAFIVWLPLATRRDQAAAASHRTAAGQATVRT